MTMQSLHTASATGPGDRRLARKVPGSGQPAPGGGDKRPFDHTMPGHGATVQKLQEAGAQERVKVRSAPVTEEFARRIGADGYRPNASTAVTLAKALVA